MEDMIIAMRPGTPDSEICRIRHILEEKGLRVDTSMGQHMTVLGVLGDTSGLNPKDFEGNPWVEKAARVQEPYKRVSRLFHPDDTVVDVGGVKVGGKKLAVIAGPCSVETRDQMKELAEDVKDAGASMMRGGAFKPRTSPYSFQGLHEEGLHMLEEAGHGAGLPVVTEIMSADKIEEFEKSADLIQVGARNMQNFELLKELGKIRKPILLKRGLSATIEEGLLAAEYIMAGGNPNVILCERGIRTFETYTRNTLDLSAVPAVKKLSHLPVIVDPSHAAGLWWMVAPLAKAAVAVGADGLIIEVHQDPDHALCDGAQSLKPKKFARLMEELKPIAAAAGREC